MGVHLADKTFVETYGMWYLIVSKYIIYYEPFIVLTLWTNVIHKINVTNISTGIVLFVFPLKLKIC